MTASIPDERGQFEYVLVCGLDVTEQTWHDNVQGSLRRVATLVASGAGGSALMDAVTSEIGRLFEGQSANLLQLDGTEGLIAGAWSSGDALTWEVGTQFPVVGDTASGPRDREPASGARRLARRARRPGRARAVGGSTARSPPLRRR